jgi:sortase B
MPVTKTKKGKRKGALLLILVIVLLIVGATAIIAPVLLVEMELLQDSEEYERLKEQSRVASTQEPPQEETSEAADPVMMHEIEMNPQFVSPIPIGPGKTGVDLAACKAENDDFIAWLQIPGTTVDYPVVLSNDTQYYLEHTFTGKKSYLGTLFSLGKTDYHTPGKNIAIYGHHIRSNGQVMFSPLISYKKQSFYEDHKTIYLDSLYHSDTYIVFAVVNMRSGDWDQSATSFASDDAFLDYVQRARSQALYETGVVVTAKDQILTLNTCDRGFIPKYGRLVIMAVRQNPNNQSDN